MRILSKILIVLILTFSFLSAKSFRSSSFGSRSSSFRSSSPSRSFSSPKSSTSSTRSSSLSSVKSTPKVTAVKQPTPKTTVNSSSSKSTTIINNTTVNKSDSSNGFVNGVLVGSMLNRPSTVVVDNHTPIVREHEETTIYQEDEDNSSFGSVVAGIMGFICFIVIIAAVVAVFAL